MSVLVSVIMPTYNCGKYIADAVNSVINQTVDDWEIQIVDDCSTDNTKEVLTPFIKKYPQIKYYCLDKNSGPALARSEAIRRATGKYCSFLDSDDLWLPNKIEYQIHFMEKNHLDFSCSAYKTINADSRDSHQAIIPPKIITYSKCIQLANPIGNLTATYNQENLGKFVVPNIKRRNDFALWLQILKKTEYCYGIDEVLALYRAGRPGSISHNKLELAKYHWQLYRTIEKHSIIRSTAEVCCWAFVKSMKLGKNTKTI